MKILAKVAAVAASGAALVLMAPAQSQALTGELIIHSDTGKCMEIENSSKANGARAQQWTCKNQAGAQWQLRFVGGGYYNIVNLNSGKCLEIADSRKDLGAPVQQWSCVKGLATQLWYLNREVGKPSAPIVNMNASGSLSVGGVDVTPVIKDNGARVVLGEYGQQWVW
ncbi:RICIN domain-containing protein [Streptomyces sp. NPDC053048]|uniref:RICIN domain-containing protein n=1 Tax=Streptomyces sp. NPDC053048 TaxID=3365694 RepID=UPI0037D5C48C